MNFRIALLAAALCCATAAHAAPMSKETYKAQQVRVEHEYDAAQARCKPLRGNARDICNEQVRGARDVRMAELELLYKPTPEADEKLRMAKAEAIYAVSLQRCKALDARSAKEICRKDAKAVLSGARVEAKLQKDVVTQEMRSEKVVRDRAEVDEKRAEAQFAAARERCEMVPAEGREGCLLDARRRFGKL